MAAAVTRTVLAYLYAESPDVAYNFSQAGVFCLVEMTAAILVFTAPTVPKPIHHLATQASGSLSRLLNSSQRSDTSYQTGFAGVKSEYHRTDEYGNEVPLVKLRSAKSKTSFRNGSNAVVNEV